MSLVLLLLMVVQWGCRVTPRYAADEALPTALPHAAGLESPQYLDVLQAAVTPPVGWLPDPLKSTSRHKHQVWISPTGKTAYGVIHFSLPFPLGHEPVLWAFMNEMRRSEGEAELLSKQWDANLRALRFVAEGGLYMVRTNLQVRGFNGWAIYAGTLRAHAPVAEELDLAERARERTIVGRVVSDRAGN